MVEEKVERQTGSETLNISHSSDIHTAQKTIQSISKNIGFNDLVSEELVIVTKELASNLLKHAKRGILIFTPMTCDKKTGIQIESIDDGPGIKDIEQAIMDRFSSAGSLGIGLGAVNRMMDEFKVIPKTGLREGTHIICRRWVAGKSNLREKCPLGFGAATRPHPKETVNGDCFVIKHRDGIALTAVIDGVGHGYLAAKAAEAARQYIENHFDQSLPDIFSGIGRTCRNTRGVVVAIARFDWFHEELTFASVGNIEVRVFDSPEKFNFIVRRGIVGSNAPNPVVTHHKWHAGNVMVLHSDGLSSRWKWKDFSLFKNKPAQAIAGQILRTLTKGHDDATVVVVKGIVK